MQLQKIKINIPVTIMKEGKRFVAYTSALDISTSAPTFKKVEKRFAEMVQIFFEELCKTQTLKDVLTECGWKKVDKHYVPPRPIANIQETFSVPCRA